MTVAPNRSAYEQQAEEAEPQAHLQDGAQEVEKRHDVNEALAKAIRPMTSLTSQLPKDGVGREGIRTTPLKHSLCRTPMSVASHGNLLPFLPIGLSPGSV
jgi:hypothetical protein